MANPQAQTPALTSSERLRPSLPGLAWRNLRRDLAGGGLNLVVLAVVLAVAAMSSVGFFVDRLERALTRDAAALLGGDAVVVADQPVPEPLRELARREGLRSVDTASFPSMVRASEARGGAMRLASLKAVGPGYPARGQLMVAAASGAPPRAVTQGPAAGQVWVDPGLLDALDLRVGDRLEIGDASLRIDAVLVREPDRGSGFSNFAPRVMMPTDDLPATGLVQDASRITWRMAVTAEGRDAPARIQRYVSASNQRIEQGSLRGVRLDSLETGRPEMRQTLDRAQSFLQLVALLAGLLAAVAVVVAAQDFARRRLDDCAMLRVLGLAQGQIAVLHVLELLVVAVGAGLLGVAAGLGLHLVFLELLSAWAGTDWPAPGPGPAWRGLAAAIVMVCGFALPAVLQLAKVPPLRVMRRDLGRIRGTTLMAWAGGGLALAVLLVLATSDRQLGLLTVGGFALALGLFAAGAWGVVELAGRLSGRMEAAPSWLRLALRQLIARRGLVVLQVGALGVGLTALILLTLIRTDLIRNWQQSTPPGAPDRFVINIQPDQEQAVRDMLSTAGVKEPDWYPMIRGRWVALNGRPVQVDAFEGERARRLADREFNLSHAAQAPGHNRIVAGRWVAEEADGLSVEEGLAGTLGLRLGDVMRFDVAGQIVEGRITSLRRVDWASMRVNFFVMFPRERMPDLPATTIAAYRSAGPELDRRLVRSFPNLTQVDVGATLAQVQSVVAQVSRAVEFLFLFALACGVVVLVAAVVASREQRLRDFAVMRALGAGSSLLGRVQDLELLAVGALSGLLSAFAAGAVASVLARRVFDFTWELPWWLPFAGMLAGALVSWLGGRSGLRGILRAPVVPTLRRYSGA